MYKEDTITKLALKAIEETNEVLETKEIEQKISHSIKNITRTKLFARLNILRGEGLISGKFVGPGKGVWIWWKKSAFSNTPIKFSSGRKKR
jgi:hypothetical protein